MPLPTGRSESISEASSGANSISGEDLTPELFAQVQQAIAPAPATPLLQKLIGLTQPTVLEGAIAAVLNYRKTHRVSNLIGLLRAAIRQQWQPQQPDRSTPVEFPAWFDWARSNRLAIASQQLDGVLHIYATDGRCYPYTEFVASHPMPET